MVFAAYSKDGEFEDKISHIASLTRRGALPFILLMDANSERSKVQKFIDDLALDTETVLPRNAEVTCHQGKGSCIDFFIISDLLLPYVASTSVVTTVPSGPHDGIEVAIRRDPRAAKTGSPGRLSAVVGAIPPRSGCGHARVHPGDGRGEASLGGRDL